MNVLVLKLGAAGDVVRTTTILHKLEGNVTWVTAAKNTALLADKAARLRVFSWEERNCARGCAYDLVINLEETEDVAEYVASIEAKRTFGAHLLSGGGIGYTEDSKAWFDLSLLSRFGRQEADHLKLRNRSSYQELIFAGLGLEFAGEPYVLPKPVDAGLRGDVAIAPQAGPVWPMKNWAFYEPLKRQLEGRGLVVNVLPLRGSLLEHLADVAQHRCLVSGDCLPMHLALGTRTRCVTLFTCTSPWEIYDYGLQTKIVSPLLGEFFYQRGFDRRATTAISMDEVLKVTLAQLE